MNVNIAFDISTPNLYKFWAMPVKGEKEEKFLREFLIGNNLFFQAAHKLNDPFDCLPAIYTAFSPDRARKFFERRVRYEMPDVTDADCQAEVQRRTDRFDFSIVDTPGFQIGARDAFIKYRERMAVYCLSARVDSVLMWSHYARNHSGFAVEFSGSDPLIGEAQRVKYLRDRPIMDPGSGDKHNMHVTLLTKARDWKYEQEWRITRIGKPGLHKYNPKSLKSIIFGMAMNNRDRQRLRAMCREGGLEPQYYEAVDDTLSFSVRIVAV